MFWKFLFALFMFLASTADAFLASPKPSCLSRSTFSRIINNAGPATLEPETIEKVKEDKKEQSQGTKMPAWEVRLFNDPFNKREFVARCLATVCGKNDTESYQIMMQAHQNGMGIIGRYDYEIAELYQKSLKDNGLLVDMVPVDDE